MFTCVHCWESVGSNWFEPGTSRNKVAVGEPSAGSSMTFRGTLITKRAFMLVSPYFLNQTEVSVSLMSYEIGSDD